MYNFKDKLANIHQLNNYMLAKTLTMFEWENLPDSLPSKELEYLLQTKGYAFLTMVEGELYALWGSIGGKVDAYNRPTEITINNVGLNFNKTLDIKKDGVLISNDDMRMGLMPLFNKHHSMLIENDINITIHGYNTRMQKLISASDDKTKQSAELYIKKSIDGDIAIIGENAILEGVKVHTGNSNNSVSISSMIELTQYLKGSLYNEVGLSSAFNMKKERLITAEVDQSEDSLFPYVYNMMKCRTEAVEKVNEMFSLNIEVDFGSVWHFKNREFVDNIVNPDKLEISPNGQPTEKNTDTPIDTPSDTPSEEKEELERIINDENSSIEDIETAKELLKELTE